jgi:adenylate cyclase
MERITVLLADDNLIVREGVRALLAYDAAVEVVGVAGDRDELVAEAARLHPRVIVTDIRMPPTFQDEGIEAAREVHRLLPGTGMLDPEIVRGLLDPARDDGQLDDADEQLLRCVAGGRPVTAIAVTRGEPPEAVGAAIEQLFLGLARGAGAGREGALRRLRMLHGAILAPGGAGRDPVHARRRHGQPRPAAAGPGPPGGHDGGERGDRAAGPGPGRGPRSVTAR